MEPNFTEEKCDDALCLCILGITPVWGSKQVHIVKLLGHKGVQHKKNH